MYFLIQSSVNDKDLSSAFEAAVDPAWPLEAAVELWEMVSP